MEFGCRPTQPDSPKTHAARWRCAWSRRSAEAIPRRFTPPFMAFGALGDLHRVTFHNLDWDAFSVKRRPF